jgi:Trypsin-like peptidase domain
MAQKRVACGILVALFSLFAHSSWAQRAIPDDNLAYPVLITLKNGGTGSGFYLNNSSATYLVTGKHVLFDPRTHELISTGAELLSYPRDLADTGRFLFDVNLSTLQAQGSIKTHQTEDIVVVKLFTVVENKPDPANNSNPNPNPNPNPPNSTPTFKLSAVPGVTTKESAASGVVGVSATSDGVGLFDSVLIGNEAMVFGYPSSLGLQQSPQFDSHRPLLRKGIVAGKYPQGHSIIIDCPVYPGNSGGPVLQVTAVDIFRKHYTVIGLASQFVPFMETWSNIQLGSYTTILNSGYSVVTPMDGVMDLIK